MAARDAPELGPLLERVVLPVLVCSPWHQGQAAESAEDGRARLASELQDFIAESRFAWSELRPNPWSVTG